MEVVQNNEVAKEPVTWTANLPREHELVGKFVAIWYSDKKRYFKGTVMNHIEGEEFEVAWRNFHRETVSLLATFKHEDYATIHTALDNLDRWSVIPSLDYTIDVQREVDMINLDGDLA